MTPLRLLALACVTLAAASGCSDPAAPVARDLVGAWVSAPAPLMRQGWHQYHLRFTTGRRFASEWRSYGVLPDQPVNELTSFSRIEGIFRQDGERLLFDPERLISWDRFYGRNSPVRVEEPYPWGGIFDSATYEVLGDRLTIHFTGYGPADERVRSTAVFTRDE